jgi:hypothetical protein
MYLRLIPVLVVIFIEVKGLEEIYNDEFVVVSTSRPFSLQELAQQLHKHEKRLEKLEDTPKHTKSLPKNCKEVQERGNKLSGIYRIKPEQSPEAFMVVCDMETRGGGWTYFLNRHDGSQDFYLKWPQYKNGFGNLAGEFWLGLDHLHYLTGHEVNELLIQLVDFNLTKAHAHYSFFSVASENEGYALKVLSGYSGDAGDSFSYHGGAMFSTQDTDHDQDSGNCATFHGGAWWYKSCMHVHLTGKYLNGTVPASKKYKGMYWETFRGPLYSLKKVRMMVKPRDDTSLPFLLH